MFKPNQELLQKIMMQFLKESYPDTYTSDEAFNEDIDPEHVKSATEFISNLQRDPDAETKFKSIAEQIDYDGDLEDSEFATQYAAKGAKIKMLKKKTTKCACGCDMVTKKEAGGKISSTCSCKCGGKMKAKKHEQGGLIEKYYDGGQAVADYYKQKQQPTANRIQNSTNRIPNNTMWDVNKFKPVTRPSTPGIVNIPKTTNIVGEQSPAVKDRINKYGNVSEAEKVRVRAWQSEHGLTPDGIWGPKTQAAFEAFEKGKSSNVQALPTPMTGVAVNEPAYKTNPINQSAVNKYIPVNVNRPAWNTPIAQQQQPFQSAWKASFKKGGKVYQAGGDVTTASSQTGVAKKGTKAPERIKKNESGSKIEVKSKLKPKPTAATLKGTPRINNTTPKNDGDEYAIPIGNNKDDNNKFKKPIKKAKGGEVKKQFVPWSSQNKTKKDRIGKTKK